MSANLSRDSIVPTLDYAQQDLTLRLQIGEITLYKRPFKAAVLRCEFAPAPPDVDKVAGQILQSTQCEMVFFSGVDATARQGTVRWGNHICFSPGAYPLYCINLTLPFDEYLKKFSSSSRKHLKRDVAKFYEYAGTEECFKEYRTPDEMRQFHESARVVSKKTFQEHLLGAGLPETPEFVEQLEREAASDNIRGYVLYHGTRPVAYAYCSALGPHLSYEKVGYDPAYKDHSPGRILLYLIISALSRDQRFNLLDFGAGEAFYKRFFATHSFARADIYYLRRTVRNLLFVTTHLGLSILSRTLVLITAKLRIKDKIKKWTRGSAQAK